MKKSLSVFVVSLLSLSFPNYAQNVGVGEAAPNTKFEIKGNTGTDLFNVKDQSDDSKLYIQNDGDVGIGTTTPSYKLHVAGNILVDNGGWVRVKGDQGIYFQDYGGGWRMEDATWIRTYGGKSIYQNTGTLRTDGTFQVGSGGSTLNVPNSGDFSYRSDVLFANTSGNVGIGTASPSSKLDVNGSVRVAGKVINVTDPTNPQDAATKAYVDAQVGGVTETDPTWSGAANTTASVGRTGNVGIGTTSPVGKLHIAGGNLVMEDGNYFETTGDDFRFTGGANDDAYEWTGYYSGSTRQGIILYDGAWTGANNITNEFSITAENSNKLTLNTSGGDIALMPDGSGNVGVGTLSPGATLHINGTTLAETHMSLSAGDGKGFRFWNSDNYKIHMGDDAEYQYGPVTNYSIKSNMNTTVGRGWTWGIDGSAPVMALENNNGHLALKGALYLDCVTCGSTSEAYPASGSGWGNAVLQGRVFSTSSNLHLSPPGGSNVIINDTYRAGGGSTSGSDAGLIVEGNAAINSTGLNGSYHFYVNGRIGTNGINETSDKRFKKDIQPLEGSLGKLLQLEGVSYHWRHDEFPDREFREGKDMGVIAQEVEKIFPEVVDTDEEGYKSVQYSSLVPVLIEAVKEQNKEIENLKEGHKQELTCLNQKIEHYENLFDGIDVEAFKQAFAKENYTAKK